MSSTLFSSVTHSSPLLLAEEAFRCKDHSYYLQRDLRYSRRLLTTLAQSCDTDDSRLLGIVSCGPDGSLYLGRSIERLIAQTERSPCHSANPPRLDLIIGRNCGASLGDALRQVSQRDDVEIHSLTADARKFDDVPALVRDPTSGERAFLRSPHDRSGHRIFVIDQTPCIHGRGKIRMLSDIYNFCLSSILKGEWKPPSTTLSFDAESWFIENPVENSPNLQTNGLARMQSVLERERLDFVGARWLNCGYEAGAPVFGRSIHPLQILFNVLHGHDWLRGMPGGGTLGKTLPTLAFGRTVATYAGARMEDFMLTTLAHHGGFRWRLDDASVVTNKCASFADRISREAHSVAQGQARRWIQGLAGLSMHYGLRSLTPVVDIASLREALFPRYSYSRIELERHSATHYAPHMQKYIEAGARELSDIFEDALESPDDPFGHAHWERSA